MSHFHAIVWIDHATARIFHVGGSGADRVVIHPHGTEPHIHHKAGSLGSGHVHEDRNFLEATAGAIADAGEILIIGPAGARTELANHLKAIHPAISRHVVGVEPADHPTDREILALARHHFRLDAPRSIPTPGAPR